MTEERRIPEWMKMPVQLQHQFFTEAGEEAERCKRRLLERARRIDELRTHIKLESIPDGEEWRSWRVAVVDGSNSPSTSERLGVRYGTYCAGYMIFHGVDQVEEGYFSDRFCQDQIGSHDVAQKVLSTLRLKLEREVALYCLREKDVDLILIDGSFFGFRAEAHLINDEVIDVGGFEKGLELTADVRDKTFTLLKSGKAVGIIKRTRTTALDGWLLYTYGDESRCISSNDKYILSMIMPSRTWFTYERLLGRPEAFNYYSRLRDVYHSPQVRRKGQASMDAVYEAAKRNVALNIKRSLDWGVDPVLQTARYYVRCCSAAPFEFEAKIGVDVKPMLPYFLGFHNPATGLPWPLDLIDSNASLPRGFNREFVEEIEAQLIRDPEVSDKIGLKEYFSYLNPQKEED